MDLTEVAIAFGAGLSLVSQLTMIYGYLKLKRMRMYPELLIFWQNLSQVILSLHWLSGLPSVFSFVSPACKEIGAVFLYFYYLCFNVILFLSIEIVIKLKYPLNCCYKSRVRMYKVLNHLVCIPSFIILITADNNDGVSIFGTCFVQHNTIYELFVFAPLVIHTPICLVLSFYTFWNTLGRKHGKNLRYHNYVVITFCFCWGFGALLHALSYFNVRETQTEILITMIILEAPCGFYIFIARISQKGLFAKIFKRTTKKKRPEINLSTQKLPFIESYSINCTNESFFLVNTFEKITIEVSSK